jgi:NAD(P)-dependent dehydrogenase (short-subunit alcohol dehydrogenase family)
VKLEGRVAIVTGGARGIGFGIAKRLAQDGARLALFDRDAVAVARAAEALRADGAGAEPYDVDVRVEEAVRTAVDSVLSQHGRIDILVNNAGIYPHTPFAELTYGEWKRVLRTNLDSVFLCSHAVFPAMVSARYGRIVNIASAVFFIGFPGLAPYTASKGGIIGFTRSLAAEAAEHGITVNAVAPGMIATEGVLEGEEAGLIDVIVAEQAVKRRGVPEDIAECVAYLVDPAASFITGQTVNVDGGHRFH